MTYRAKNFIVRNALITATIGSLALFMTALLVESGQRSGPMSNGLQAETAIYAPAQTTVQ